MEGWRGYGYRNNASTWRIIPPWFVAESFVATAAATSMYSSSSSVVLNSPRGRSVRNTCDRTSQLSRQAGQDILSIGRPIFAFVRLGPRSFELCLFEATYDQRCEVDAWDTYCRRRARRASKGPAPCLLFEPQEMQELSSSVTAQHGSLDSLVVGSQLSKLDLCGIRQNVADHLLEYAGFECDGVCTR